MSPWQVARLVALMIGLAIIVEDEDGLTMAGRGLVARNNMIYNATADGVECRDCRDTIIESNTVQRADGTGIWISGERIILQKNTVSESVLRTRRHDHRGIYKLHGDQ